MSQLFDPITFSNRPIVFYYRSDNHMPAKGYYHWHQCCELLLVHQGRGIVSVNSQTYAIKRGMLFIFQPFELHKVFAEQSDEDEPYIRTVLHLDPAALSGHLSAFPRRHEWFEHLMRSPKAPRAIDLGDQLDYLEGSYAQYDRYVRAGHGHHTEEFILFVAQLLSSVEQASALDNINNIRERRSIHYSEQIMRWIDQHLGEDFDLGQLADHLHLSKFYVSRVFRSETGSSITEYLRARRIMQACHLLDTTEMSVEQIGSAVGLANTSHFIHIFKQTVGITPLKYKKSQHGGN